MNHFDEITCLSYLEGQLDPARSRELVAHAAGCSQCRAVLQTLQRETSLLTTALTEANEHVPARLLAIPGWKISSWIWMVSFGLFAAGAYWLWTGTISPWLQQLSNTGFGGTDLLTMLVVSGAFWEGWSDMIDLLQISALLILGGVAFGLFRRHFRRSAVVGIAMIVLALALIAWQRGTLKLTMARGDAVTVGLRDGSAAGRAAERLIDMQNSDGSWDEALFTGTGFPLVFYLRYHLYRNSFPLYALARYRNQMEGTDQAEGMRLLPDQLTTNGA